MTRPLTNAFGLRSVVLRLVPLAVLSLSAVAARAQPGGDDNAALQYWQAIALVSESMEESLSAWEETVPIEGDALTVVADDNPRLDLLHAGAAMKRCDWGLGYEKGPELLLSHVGDVRYLSRIALLRARYRFEQGRARDATDDVLATFELARDVGIDPILVAVLVQYGIEDHATDLLARHLAKLSPDDLERLARRMDEAPPRNELKEVWKTETRFMVDWVEERLKRAAGEERGTWAERVLGMPVFKDRKQFRKGDVPPLETMLPQLEEIRAYYRYVEKLADLPPDKQDAGVAQAKALVAGDNLLFGVLAADVQHVFRVRRLHQARRAMLRAAVAVQHGGPERLKDEKFGDPFGSGGPFEYRKTAGGFELRSKLTRGGKPETLAVGTPDPE